MRLCDRCGDPATAFAYDRGGATKVTAAFCYLHGVEAGIAEPMPEWVAEASRRAGLSANAVLFVADAYRVRAWLCRTAMGCCIAVWQAAEEQFGRDAGDGLRAMGVVGGTELARITRALLAVGAFQYAEGEQPGDIDGLESIGEIP